MKDRDRFQRLKNPDVLPLFDISDENIIILLAMSDALSHNKLYDVAKLWRMTSLNYQLNYI